MGVKHAGALTDAWRSSSPADIQGLVDDDFTDDPFRYAAEAMEGVSTMHPFAEGNKCTAFMLALRILNRAEYTPEDSGTTGAFVIEASMGRHSVYEIEAWLRENAITRPTS